MSHPKPILRWAGSKKKLLPILLKSVPKEFNLYIEPFCGSLNLFLALRPEKALLSDINHELIDFYKTLTLRPYKISELVHGMPTSEDFYYRLRSINPETLSKDQKATRFFYLNRYCFNGVFRTNRSGQFNVPRGTHTGGIPKIEEIIKFRNLIKFAEFEVSDFESKLASAQKNDFVYLDPPYMTATTKDRGEYGVHSFKHEDLNRLINSCHEASSRGAKLLLSYSECDELISAFGDWHITYIDVHRSISGFNKGRGTVKEVLISNFR
jgi:DNA adenine methylase